MNDATMPSRLYTDLSNNTRAKTGAAFTSVTRLGKRRTCATSCRRCGRVAAWVTGASTCGPVRCARGSRLTVPAGHDERYPLDGLVK